MSGIDSKLLDKCAQLTPEDGKAGPHVMKTIKAPTAP